ncbi:MAG: pseudouridine synthase, partial [Clostridia bacterium]|nr:pseudouridine synthase [Clostridia bacterium]
KTSPAQVEILSSEKGETVVKITIHEGKNRQVRKMFESLGYSVKALKRVAIGPVELGSLQVGRWRHLTSVEVGYLSGGGKKND